MAKPRLLQTISHVGETVISLAQDGCSRDKAYLSVRREAKRTYGAASGGRSREDIV